LGTIGSGLFPSFRSYVIIIHEIPALKAENYLCGWERVN